MDKLQIIETTKGKPSAILNGYQYRQHRVNKQGTISWLCIKEKSENCRGTLKTKNGELLSVSEHLCKPNLAEVDIKKQQLNCKKRARETDCNISTIYKEEMGQLFDRGFDFVAEVPLFTTMKTTLYRNRRKEQGHSSEPSSAGEIVFSDQSLLMKDGSSFLFHDDADGDRLIVFASLVGREILSSHKVFFMDGTFKCCSKQFTQLYTIHADIGSNTEETNIIPVAFALLKNKTRQTYERLFRLLKGDNWNPSSVTIDFEQAVISAIQNVFPTVELNGCHFHYTQCIWRKVQEVGMVTEYKNNDEIRLHIRMCAALAYLPLEDLDDGWLTIQESSPNNEKLQEFYDYYVEQWLQNSTITKNMWNCYNKMHRTNNAVEGWNNRLGHVVSRSHPRVLDLVKHLKEESEQSDFFYRRKELSLAGEKRKSTYIKLDQRIQKILTQYNESKDIKVCLKALAYVTKLE